jgi:hypothetical protein
VNDFIMATKIDRIFARTFTMHMRGALANPGRGVVGCVRRLGGSYGAQGGEGLWMAGRRSGLGQLSRGA